MPNTNNITVLGKGTSKQQVVVSMLEKYLQKAGLEISIEQSNDVDVFIQKGIESIPSIITDKGRYQIKSNGKFSKSLRTAIKEILKESNFGDIEKIVIPVDFSDTSVNAFAYGHRLASDLEAITKAIHVFSLSSKIMAESQGANLDFENMRREYFSEFINDFDSDWGSDILKTSLIDKEFRVGFAADEILDSIEENAAYLTIMGATGESGFIKKWLGSVSTKVMNESTSPVLLIPKTANYKGVKRVVFAYDEIDQDKRILSSLVSFAKKFDAHIHLLHVENGEHPDPGFYLTELLKEHYPDQKIRTTSIVGKNVVQSINSYCQDNDIDIICLSTHKKGLLEMIFNKSTSKELSITSSIPLLVLKPSFE